MRKIIVDGSFSFTDYCVFCDKLKNIIGTDSVELVCADEMDGVSSMCRLYGELNKIPIMLVPIRAGANRKAAYIERNRDMASYADEAAIFIQGRDKRLGPLLKEVTLNGLKVYTIKV